MQTCVPDEILIGDDSDDDAMFCAIEAVRGQFSGELRYIRNPQRLGFKQNFIHLAREAKGDFIFFCDQDDVWLPEKIETLAEVLEKDSDCQVVLCNSEMVDSELNSLGKTMLSGIPGFHRKIEEINRGRGFFPLLNLIFPFAGHNTAMKRSFLPIFLQIPEFCTYHDVWLFQTAGLLGQLRYVDKVLTRYRVHGNNVSAPRIDHRRRTFLQQFRENQHVADDVFALSRQLQFYTDFMTQNAPDNRNRESLECYARYFAWRTKILRMPRYRRFPLLTLHPHRLRDYFRCGSGLRSLVRDLIVAPVSSDGRKLK